MAFLCSSSKSLTAHVSGGKPYRFWMRFPAWVVWFPWHYYKSEPHRYHEIILESSSSLSIFSSLPSRSKKALSFKRIAAAYVSVCVSTETAAGFLWTKAQSLEERIGWDMCSTDRGILWWLCQAFLLFSDVLRQSYSCLMLSPLGKEAPHIHHAQRAPAPFQVSLNTLSWPGRWPDGSQSWTGSSQHSELASISSLYGFMCARVCRCYLIYSGVLCLSTELVYLAEDLGGSRTKDEIADVLHGLHHLTNSCWHGMKRELRFSYMYLTY